MASEEIRGEAKDGVSLKTGRTLTVKLAGTLPSRLKKDTRDRIRAFATRDPAAFGALLTQVYRTKVDDKKREQLVEQAKAGQFPIPETIRFLTPEEIKGKHAAYTKTENGTTFLNASLKPDYDKLLDAYTEETGHHVDAVVLGGDDTQGDEGSMLAAGIRKGAVLTKEEEKERRRWRDAGKLTVDGKEVAVEFDSALPFVERNGQKIPLFMHSKTFDTIDKFKWVRDDIELEGVFALTGVDGKALFTLLQAGDRRLFRRLRRFENIEAFSLGFPIDEIPWSEDALQVRLGRIPDVGPVIEPYVWLTIESDRFAVDRERNRRRLSMGTDYMDDIYYDTDDFLLLKNNITVRARKRWDEPTQMRRLLIGHKTESGVDALGNKRAAKIDIRKDFSSGAPLDDPAITGLDQAVQRGHNSWDDAPAEPLEKAYSWLRNRDFLTDAEGYEDVLVIKSKSFLRSVRSRYHLNECSLEHVRRIYDLARSRLEALAGLAEKAVTDGLVEQARADAVRAFVSKIKGSLDASLLAERTKDALGALGHDTATKGVKDLLPGTTGPGSSASLDDLVARKPEVDRRKVVADAFAALAAEICREFDDGSQQSLRRVITGTLDRALDDHAAWFQAWQVSVDASLGPIRTFDRFVELHAAKKGKQAEADAYNAYGEGQKGSNRDFRDFARLDLAAFDKLDSVLRNEQLRIWARQIEVGGAAARGLWFDEAREFYVPDSDRSTGNFIIDTTDFAAMYKPDVIDGVPNAERTGALDLGQAPYLDKLFHAVLVNEGQIELTSVGDYTKRVHHMGSLNELPRAFMRWADASGQGGGTAQYKAHFDQLKGLPDEELQKKLASLNDAITAANGYMNSISATEFREWLDPARLLPEVRDGSAEDAKLKTALEGVRFVFERYRETLPFISRLKERFILDTIRDGGAQGVGWGPSPASKGSQALALMRGMGP